MKSEKKFALKYVTIIDGKISTISDAYPPHELKPNQFEITEEEYWLLNAVKRADGNIISHARKLLTDIDYKFHVCNGKLSNAKNK